MITVGRLSVLLLVLALMLGMTAHAAGGRDIVVPRDAATVSYVSMPDGCNGCGSTVHEASAACAVFCSGVLPVPASFTAVEAGVSIFFLSTSPLAGRRGPPDPYPPRPFIMS